MTEGVEVIGDARRGAEVVAEIAPALGDRPDERFGPGQVDIGLDEPASGDGPAARLDQLADVLEERRIEALGPLIEHGLVVAEDERGMLIEDIDSVPESRQGLGRALVPPPLPHRVEMGVTDQVDRRDRRG